MALQDFNSYIISHTQLCPALLLPMASGVLWCLQLLCRALSRCKTQASSNISPLAPAEPWKSSDKVVLPFKQLVGGPQSSIKRERNVCSVIVPHICLLSLIVLNFGQDLGLLSVIADVNFQSPSGSFPKGWIPIVPF